MNPFAREGRSAVFRRERSRMESPPMILIERRLKWTLDVKKGMKDMQSNIMISGNNYFIFMRQTIKKLSKALNLRELSWGGDITL